MSFQYIRDSNPQLLEHEPPPIATRPGHPPKLCGFSPTQLDNEGWRCNNVLQTSYGVGGLTYMFKI